MGGRFRKNDDSEGTSWSSTLINYLGSLPLPGHGAGGSFPSVHVDTPNSSHDFRPTASTNTEMSLDMNDDLQEDKAAVTIQMAERKVR